ncbi:MAG TPA: HAMP domain-containing sensor histidine kinase [Polyangiaceae bacterium]|nr:HAMP domain-containing sensor histidine kinase [Polyangiaceae bacterium]
MWQGNGPGRARGEDRSDSDGKLPTDAENSIGVAEMEAPAVICSNTGKVRNFTKQARVLMSSLGVELATGSPLPASLWAALTQVPIGESTEWRPEAAVDAILGCTAYRLGSARRLILMRELSTRNVQLLQRLHKQRLEFAGRMVASIAHDLRTTVASIVYNAGFLRLRQRDSSPPEVTDVLKEMVESTDRLRRTVDGLLDFVRLGPQLQVDFRMREIVDRTTALLDSVYRKRRHALVVDCNEREWVSGNPIVVEQVLANLLLNAAEASEQSLRVSITVDANPADANFVRTIVQDDGPGIPPERARRVFEPFFTSKPDGTGLGLTMAKEAALKLDGDLFFEPSEVGARFVLLLPRGRAVERAGE